VSTTSFLSRLLGGLGLAGGHRGTAEAGVPLRIPAGEFLSRKTPDAPVLDVRTPGEFAGGHLRGARNLDVMGTDFADAVDRLGLDRNAPIYVYCRSGNRSGNAVKILRGRGYVAAVNVGGVEGLIRAGATMAR
jgi:phage shock protein E